jgi:hypothetical protein
MNKPEILSLDEMRELEQSGGCPGCKECTWRAIARNQNNRAIAHYENLIPKIVAEAKREFAKEIEQNYRFPTWVGCINPDCNSAISQRCKPLGQCPHAWFQQLLKKHGIGE